MLTITGRLRYDVVRRLLPARCPDGPRDRLRPRRAGVHPRAPILLHGDRARSGVVCRRPFAARPSRATASGGGVGARGVRPGLRLRGPRAHRGGPSRPVPLARACPSGWLVAHQRSGTSKPLRRDRRSRRSLPAVRRRRPPGCPRPRRLSRRVPVLVRLSRGLCAPLREQAARSTRRRLRGGSNGCQRTLAATFSDHCVRSPPGRRTVLIGAASVRQQVGGDRPRRPSPSCARIEGARLPSHSSCTAAWRGFGERPDAARALHRTRVPSATTQRRRRPRSASRQPGTRSPAGSGSNPTPAPARRAGDSTRPARSAWGRARRGTRPRSRRTRPVRRSARSRRSGRAATLRSSARRSATRRCRRRRRRRTRVGRRRVAARARLRRPESRCRRPAAAVTAADVDAPSTPATVETEMLRTA